VPVQECTLSFYSTFTPIKPPSHSNIIRLRQGFSNCGTRTTTARPTNVNWDAALVIYIYIYIYIFIHLAVCLTTGPKPLPNRALHIVRSRASSFNCEYTLLSLRSSSSFLRLLPRLPVTSIPPFIFPSITLCWRQFLHRMWPIKLAFRFLISCRIFLYSLTLSNTSSFLTWSAQLIFYIYIYIKRKLIFKKVKYRPYIFAHMQHR